MQPRDSHGDEPIPIAIIGAGFAGLGMAIRLLATGRRDFVIFEKAESLGGTWRDNTYPGCGCDIPSHLYSFSFEQDPGWSRSFASQAEILRYLQRVATKHNLRQRINFATRIVSLTWDDTAGLWRLAADDGRRFTARVVVAGTGGLHVPRLPEIPGIEQFDGPCFHSSRWRHDLPLAGKRVAVIGTGASAVQIAPAIAGEVACLSLFQRTPPWVLPRRNRPISGFARRAFAVVPGLQRCWRWLIYLEQESIAIAFTLKPKLLGHWEKQVYRHIQQHIADPQLRDALTPRYRMGCKRVLLSDDFYPALARENVELVSEPIARIDPGGVVTADGRLREADAIVLATGFKAFDFAEQIDVIGRGGRRLAEEWADGPEGYNGVLVAGYPNLFILMGPNSGLGHNSIVFMIEAQVRYVLLALRLIERGRLSHVEVREEVQKRFNAELAKRFRGTVWSVGTPERPPCGSWYRSPSGRLSALWPSFASAYWWRLRRADPRDFLDRR